MDIAVSKDFNRFIVHNRKGSDGRRADFDALALTAIFGLEVDKFDVVGFLGWVGNAADFDGDFIAIYSYDGDMLLSGSLYGVSFLLLHGFATTYHRNAGVVDKTYKVATMLAAEEFLLTVTHTVHLSLS